MTIPLSGDGLNVPDRSNDYAKIISLFRESKGGLRKKSKGPLVPHKHPKYALGASGRGASNFPRVRTNRGLGKFLAQKTQQKLLPSDIALLCENGLSFHWIFQQR